MHLITSSHCLASTSQVIFTCKPHCLLLTSQFISTCKCHCLVWTSQVIFNCKCYCGVSISQVKFTCRCYSWVLTSQVIFTCRCYGLVLTSQVISTCECNCLVLTSQVISKYGCLVITSVGHRDKDRRKSNWATSLQPQIVANIKQFRYSTNDHMYIWWMLGIVEFQFHKHPPRVSVSLTFLRLYIHDNCLENNAALTFKKTLHPVLLLKLVMCEMCF